MEATAILDSLTPPRSRGRRGGIALVVENVEADDRSHGYFPILQHHRHHGDNNDVNHLNLAPLNYLRGVFLITNTFN